MQKLLNNEPKTVHRNTAQLKYFLTKPHEGWLILGRGSGKSEGPAGDFLLDNIHKMPRANIGLYCNTYTELRTKVLPAIRANWDAMGYKQGLHYFVGELAPKKMHFPKAYSYPDDAIHYIHTYTGAGIFLVSGDRSTSNGFSLQACCVDEARLQNKAKLDEFLLTIRGKADIYGHLANHESKIFLTDMPKSNQERWVLNAKEHKTNEDQLQLIRALQVEAYKLEAKVAVSSPSYRKKLKPKLNKIIASLNMLRKGTVYFDTATSFVNIHALGMQYFKNMKRNLSDFDWDTSVMSREVLGIANGFYASLDTDKHGYTAEDYTHIDGLILTNSQGTPMRDCRWDMDVIRAQPLDIGMDHNAAINTIVTGQEDIDTYRFVSSMHVESPHYLRNLLHNWCAYYKHHPTKIVNYYYDNTCVGDNAKGDIPIYEEVINVLKSKGWSVNPIYVGQASTHHSRYQLWQAALEEKDERLKKFRYNKVNCKQWAISASDAPIAKSGNTFKKDKSSERKDRNGSYKVPPPNATHYSEAGDVLFYKKFHEMLTGKQDHFTDHITL